MEERLMGGIKGGTDARNVTLTLVKEGGDQVKGVIKNELRSPVINLNQTDQTLIQIDNRDNGMRKFIHISIMLQTCEPYFLNNLLFDLMISYGCSNHCPKSNIGFNN